VRVLFAFLLLTLAFGAHAADRFYAELHAGFGGISHSDITGRPAEVYASVGGYAWDYLGLDLTVAGAAMAGEDDGYSLSLKRLATVSFRFDSPPIENVSAFILLGVSQFDLNQESENSQGDSRTVKGSFQGGTFGIGLRHQFTHTPLSLVAMYRVHYVDQPIDVDSWSLGLRAAWR
jgi:hypothetical protein